MWERKTTDDGTTYYVNEEGKSSWVSPDDPNFEFSDDEMEMLAEDDESTSEEASAAVIGITSGDVERARPRLSSIPPPPPKTVPVFPGAAGGGGVAFAPGQGDPPRPRKSRIPLPPPKPKAQKQHAQAVNAGAFSERMFAPPENISLGDRLRGALQGRNGNKSSRTKTTWGLKKPTVRVASPFGRKGGRSRTSAK